MFCDNASTVHWLNKKSTSTSTIAGHILRALALRQHIHQTAPLQLIHIPGEKNNMADVASRSFNNTIFNSSQNSFLQTFSNQFPLQTDSWQEFKIPKKLASKVISCLFGKSLTMGSWTTTTGQEKNIGNIGSNTPPFSKHHHTWNTSPVQNNASSSQHLLLGSGQAATAKEVLSGFQQLQKHWLPFQRPSNWLGNNPQSTNQKKYTNSQWHGSLRDIEEKIHLPHPNLQYQSRFQKCAGTSDTDHTMPTVER